METKQRKSNIHLNKIRSRKGSFTFWTVSALFFLLVSLAARFFLKDENLRIFGSLAYKEILSKVALGGVFVSIILLLMKWVERVIIKESKSLASRYNLIRVLRLVSTLLVAMVIISIVFVNWYAAAVSFGVISLILSFSLQMPLSSLIAWTYILIRSPYRVGDRIRIGSFKGDVIEISYMDTSLWEIGGDYLSNDVPSGKLIRFPNSLVLQNAVFNYSLENFPYIWNEVTVYLPYNSNLEQVEKIMKDIASLEIGTKIIDDVKSFKKNSGYSALDENDINESPFVSFNNKENSWTQATVTYPVDPKQSIGMRSRLIKKIMAELQKVQASAK